MNPTPQPLSPEAREILAAMKSCVPLRHGDSTVRRALWIQAQTETALTAQAAPKPQKSTEPYPFPFREPIGPNTEAAEIDQAKQKIICAHLYGDADGLGAFRGVWHGLKLVAGWALIAMAGWGLWGWLR